MPQAIDYKAFIEDTFQIKNRQGLIVPFRFNTVQTLYYAQLLSDYPTLQGIRENDLKARQEGFSSLIDAIFTVDFIFSGMKWVPEIISGQIISHKEAETKILFRRVDFFLNCFLKKAQLERADFLKTDTDSYLECRTGAELFIGTAGAKTLGRGGTLQNLHWSEVSFYPETEILNGEEIVMSAEQQVLDGVGKIFRETTGRRKGDFFSREYKAGKPDESGLRKSEFRSRFFPWYLEPMYAKPAPSDFKPNETEERLMLKEGLTLNQIYWYRRKIETASDEAKARREYPTTDADAFLAAGDEYFKALALEHYRTRIQPPIVLGNVTTPARQAI